MRREDQTPEHRAAVIERRRARDRAKSRRRKANRRAAKIAAFVASGFHAASKTDPVTRRRLYGPAAEMTKNELRAMLTQAVRNTAEMAA
jgi:hypothetical protein